MGRRDVVRLPSSSDRARHRQRRKGAGRRLRAARRGALRGEHVYDAIASGSREFDLGHTWDGAPQLCAVGLAVLDALRRTRARRTRPQRGPSLREELDAAVGDRDDRPRGTRPRVPARRRARRPAGRRVVPPGRAGRGGARRRHGVRARAARHLDASRPDGFAGDQMLLAPAYSRPTTSSPRWSSASRATLERRRARVGATSRPRRERTRSSSSWAFPDVNGYLRGKALRPDAFESAVEHGTVMTDLLLALDPVDTPITDYERFGIRSGAADLVVRPDPTTLHELTWRPGWSVCLATPSLAGRLAVRARHARGVPRRARGIAASSATRSWPRSSTRCGCGTPTAGRSRAGSATAWWRSGGTMSVRRRLVPALEGLGVELTAVHTEAGPGLLELNLGRPARAARGRRRRAREVRGQGRRRHDGHARELPRQDEPRRGGLERPRPHVVLDGETNAFAAPRGRRAADAVRLGDRRRRSSTSRRVAAAQPDDQLLQAPGARLVRAGERELGLREPLVRRPGDPVRPRRAVAVRVPPARARTPTRTSRWPRSRPRPRTASARRSNRPPPIEGDAYARRRRAASCPARSRAALRAFEADEALRSALGDEFSDYYATPARGSSRPGARRSPTGNATATAARSEAERSLRQDSAESSSGCIV